MKLLMPLTIKNMTIKNRVVMPPMCMYACDDFDGKLNDFHFTHYLTRAIGGVGLIIIESTGVLPEGRITNKDLGIWDDAFIEDFKSLVNKLHKHQTTVGIQINHAGRKSKIEPAVSSSEKAFGNYQKPKKLTIEEIDEIILAYGKAASRANDAGFDYLEIHGAHGYLINQFTSSLVNDRTDMYQAGAGFLNKILEEVHKYWPKEKILGLRISASEYDEFGLTPEKWVDILNNLKFPIDVVNVSSGGTVLKTVEDYPGYQIPYAKTIKENTKLMVIAGGLIDDIELAEKTLKSDDADLIYYGRKLLRDPYFLLRETEITWPENYTRGKKNK